MCQSYYLASIINLNKVVTYDCNGKFLTHSTGVGCCAPILQMTIITDIRTSKPIISIFHGETDGNNAENMIFPIMVS